MIVPPLKPVLDGQILTKDLINHIIKRTEYGAELLRQYKAVAGNNIFVEQGENGLVISYLNAIAGGAGTGSGGQGTGQSGQGTGQGGAGIGAGGAGTQQPAIKIYTIPWNTRDDISGRLYPVSLIGSDFPPSVWSALLNQYAVWINPGVGYPAAAGVNYTFEYQINFIETTTYKISASGDNTCRVFLDGVEILNGGFSTAASITLLIEEGIHKIKTIGFNNPASSPLWSQNPGAWAVLIDYAT